jgi:hypothetical protein
MRPWVPVSLSPLLLLSACSGASSSELFTSGDGPLRPTGAPTQAASPAADAGAKNGGGDASLPAPGPAPSVDAAVSQLPPEAATPSSDDSGSGLPGPEACPLFGEAMTTIDDGSSAGADASILPQCGRGGDWYVFNDGAATQLPAASGDFGPFLTDSPPNLASGYVRTSGMLQAEATGTPAAPHWGAGFGFDIDSGSGVSIPYDVTPYHYLGVSFWVRTGQANQVGEITFSVPTRETQGYADGAFHELSFPAPVPAIWTKVTVPFASLTQPPSTPAPERVPFDPGALVTLQWNFRPAAQMALTFDVAIGDVEFW